MKDYDVDARPVKNQSQPVKVELELLYKELKKMVRTIREDSSTFFM